jgi:hypothetical protein
MGPLFMTWYFRRLGVLLVIAAAVCAWPRAMDAQADAGGRHLLVSVTDGSGAPVEHLQPSDLTVREDGVAREVLSVSPAPPPTHVALVVDNSAAALTFITDLRQALAAFSTTVTKLSPAPHVLVETSGERPTRTLDFSPAGEAVDRAVGRIFPMPGAGSYWLEAIVDVATRLKSVGAERPVIVAFVVSAGPEFSTTSHTAVADALRQAHAPLWTVELQDPAPPQSFARRERAMVVTDVASASGGGTQAVLASISLPQAFGKVATAIGARYDVVYARPDDLVPPRTVAVTGRDSSWHVSVPSWANQ